MVAVKTAALRRGQRLLRGAGGDQRSAPIACIGGGDTGLGQRPLGERRVDVVAAERRVAAGGDDLEHAARHAQQRDVERAAAEVVDGIEPFAGVVEPVGDRRRGRLADQPQHLEAGELGGVLGRLALGIVEIRGHRDDGAVELGVEGVFGALAKRRQDLRRDLDRRLDARRRAQAHHAFARFDEVVGEAARGRDVGEAAAHQALDRDDRVGRVGDRAGERLAADARRAVGEVADRRRQDDVAVAIRAGTRRRRSAPRRRASGSCRGRCRPRGAACAGPGEAPGSEICSSAMFSVPAPRGGLRRRSRSAR